MGKQPIFNSKTNVAYKAIFLDLDREKNRYLVLLLKIIYSHVSGRKGDIGWGTFIETLI